MNKFSKKVGCFLLIAAMFISFAGCSDDDNKGGNNPITNPFANTYWSFVENYEGNEEATDEWTFHHIGFYSATEADYGATNYSGDVEERYWGTYTFSNNTFEMTYENSDKIIVKLSGTKNGEELTVTGIPNQNAIIFKIAKEVDYE